MNVGCWLAVPKRFSKMRFGMPFAFGAVQCWCRLLLFIEYISKWMMALFRTVGPWAEYDCDALDPKQRSATLITIINATVELRITANRLLVWGSINCVARRGVRSNVIVVVQQVMRGTKKNGMHWASFTERKTQYSAVDEVNHFHGGHNALWHLAIIYINMYNLRTLVSPILLLLFFGFSFSIALNSLNFPLSLSLSAYLSLRFSSFFFSLVQFLGLAVFCFFVDRLNTRILIKHWTRKIHSHEKRLAVDLFFFFLFFAAHIYSFGWRMHKINYILCVLQCSGQRLQQQSAAGDMWFLLLVAFILLSCIRVIAALFLKSVHTHTSRPESAQIARERTCHTGNNNRLGPLVVAEKCRGKKNRSRASTGHKHTNEEREKKKQHTHGSNHPINSFVPLSLYSSVLFTHSQSLTVTCCWPQQSLALSWSSARRIYIW